jgi:predicted dehydrogenase
MSGKPAMPAEPAMPAKSVIPAKSVVPAKSAVAVAGCGYWGKNLVRNFHQLGALVAVCDPQEAGRKLAAEVAPGVEVSDSFEAALAAPAVAIATPAETHYELARRALMAGRDVFVEKPLALTYEQGRELVRLARDGQRILMVGHVLEYHPAIVRLGELIDSGELGQVHYVYSHRLSLGKVRREENILWSFAPHDIAVILRLVGELPERVSATGGSYLQPGIADVTVTSLKFADGRRAHIHVSWLHPFKEQRLVVVGAHKMASFDDVGKRLVLYDQRVELGSGTPLPIRHAGDTVPYADDEPLRNECQAFLDAVASRRPPLTDGESGLRVLEVLEAAQLSLARQGVPLALARRADPGSP